MSIVIDNDTGTITGLTAPLLVDSSVTAQTTNAVASNITSISLTAGTWDISLVVESGGSGAATYMQAGISATSATFTGTEGKDWIYAGANATGNVVCASIPRVRKVLGATTTIYAVAKSNITITSQVNAYLSAVRVAL